MVKWTASEQIKCLFLTSISPYVKNLPTELTESEKNNPFAKYYYEEMGAITEEHEAAIISAPLAPEDCLYAFRNRPSHE